MIEASGENAAQIEFWNGEAASAWTENQERMDVLLEPLSNAAFATLAVKPNERVLDVGCGCGGTTLRLVELGARATGIDISSPMLERARQRAAAHPGANFVLADASNHRLEPVFDALFSRFGVMFFADPLAAFANLHAALERGGRMAFVCWQAPRLNAWMAIPGAAAREHLPEQPAADPRAPGPFAFADREYLGGILTGAGFERVAIESFETDLRLGGDLEEALNFTVRVGPLSRQMAGVDPAVRHRAMAAVSKALEPHVRNGAVRLGARVWIVSAQAS